MDLAGTVAVVTGGASGIGRGSALAFARRGAAVVIADIHEQRTAAVVAELEAMGAKAIGVRCDVTSDDDVDALAARTIAEMGRVDVVMNNAGASVLGPPEQVPMDMWRWQLEVNTFSVVRGIRAFVPHLIDQGSGWVVNTASVAGLYAYSYDAIPYITSKHAVVGLSEGLYLHLVPKGVGVSCLCPGLVATNLGETARFAGITDPAWTNFPAHMSRAVEPEAVGEMVAVAIEEERFLIVTHDEDAAMLADRSTDRDGHLRGYVQRLYEGRGPDGLPLAVPVPDPSTPT